MNKKSNDITLSLKIWGSTLLVLNTGLGIYIVSIGLYEALPYIVVSLIASALASLPALAILLFTIYRIEWLQTTQNNKIKMLLFSIFLITALYGLIAGLLFSAPFNENSNWKIFFETGGAVTGILYATSCIGVLICLIPIRNYFTNSSNIKYITVELQEQQIPDGTYAVPQQNQTNKNKVLVKAGITAILILLMMIPMAFIQNLVKERENLQQEIAKNVNSKWSSAQTISNPYLVIPYTYLDEKGNQLTTRSYLILFPDQLNVNGKIIPTELHRSLHEVLLYSSEIKMDGTFQLSRLLKNKPNVKLLLSDATICFGISDFKGIEENPNCVFNGSNLIFTPGLPVTTVDTVGLNAAINISPDDLTKSIPFTLHLKIRGSEGLQFLPLSGNSEFNIISSWPHPSFSGNTAPSERKISKDGFTAKWKFNQANLPFNLVIKDENIHREKIAFGASMIEPVDEYAQTMRCAKYAILIIGLTFALSFIIEILQKKPVHPIQYILIGLALAIFYTLLLSISEFILFDYAYIISSLATIALIVFYMQSHFKSLKIASLFTAILSMLYGFIFVLIKLEDTALLVGSIALFIILGMVMYATRKINWYKL